MLLEKAALTGLGSMFAGLLRDHLLTLVFAHLLSDKDMVWPYEHLTHSGFLQAHVWCPHCTTPLWRKRDGSDSDGSHKELNGNRQASTS